MFLIGEQIRVCSAILAGLGARREVLLEVVAHLLQNAEDLRRAGGVLRVNCGRMCLRSKNRFYQSWLLKLAKLRTKVCIPVSRALPPEKCDLPERASSAPNGADKARRVPLPTGRGELVRRGALPLEGA